MYICHTYVFLSNKTKLRNLNARDISDNKKVINKSSTLRLKQIKLPPTIYQNSQYLSQTAF